MSSAPKPRKPVNTSALINVMSAAAVKAGKGLLRDFGEVDQLQISRKGVSNFVTKSDIRTEKLLQKELSIARPDFGFLLEESGEVVGTEASLRWIVDPLDGTSNFIHAIPYFCISIAAEKKFPNGSSEILAGVIYDPIHNDLFTAEKYKGAFLNNRRLNVSGRDNLEYAMVVSGTPRQAGQHERDAYRLAEKGATVRCLGATALDLANLAAGRIDACWYYSFQPWDIAAGLLLVQEAGGITVDLSGKPADLSSKTLLASNKSLSLSLQSLLTKAA